MLTSHKTIAIDANVLVELSAGDEFRVAKIKNVLAHLDRCKGVMVVPAVALAEFLVHADAAAEEILGFLDRKRSVRVVPFNTLCAVELAELEKAAVATGDKRGGSKAPWQKVKLDRQIVAVAKAHGATLILSDDTGVRRFAVACGMGAVCVEELPVPDEARQRPLNIPQIDEGERRPAPTPAPVSP